MGSKGAGASRRWVWIALVVILALGLAWTAVSVLRAMQAARTLRADVAVAAEQARTLQMAQLAQSVPAISTSASAYSDSVSGPLWSAMSHLPVIGTAVSSAQELAGASVAAADAATDLAVVLPVLDGDELRGPDGSINLAAMKKVGAALRAAQPDLQTAADRAASADTGSVGPVGEAAATAQEQLTSLPAVARDAAEGLDLAVELLGDTTPQRWMVLLQNGSEARGTGGFLGAYGLVEADKGVLDVGAVDTNNSLTTRIPNADMPVEFLDLWTKEYTSEWNSYNLSRHFPYTGQLSANGMALRGTPIDNVLALDAHVVAALLAGTGPITFGEDTITADTAERFFNADVYAKYPDSADKDAVVVGLMSQVLAKVTAGDFDIAATLSRLAPLVAANRISVWSADERIQEKLADHPVSAEVPQEAGPWVAAALNNSAGNKLDAFVASAVDYSADTCGAGGASTVRVTLTNNTPQGSGYAYADNYFPGSRLGATRLWTAVYGPVGAQFESADIDGKRAFVQEGEERGHPVWRWNLEIPRGASSVLTVRFTEPPSTASPSVFAQAMAVPQATSATTTSCG